MEYSVYTATKMVQLENTIKFDAIERHELSTKSNFTNTFLLSRYCCCNIWSKRKRGILSSKENTLIVY